MKLDTLCLVGEDKNGRQKRYYDGPDTDVLGRELKRIQQAAVLVETEEVCIKDYIVSTQSPD